MEKCQDQRLKPIDVDNECIITAFVCPLGSYSYTSLVSKLSRMFFFFNNIKYEIFQIIIILSQNMERHLLYFVIFSCENRLFQKISHTSLTEKISTV